jgi:hypothetical protein
MTTKTSTERRRSGLPYAGAADVGRPLLDGVASQRRGPLRQD